MMYQTTILGSSTGYFKNLYVCTHYVLYVKYYGVPHTYIHTLHDIILPSCNEIIIHGDNTKLRFLCQKEGVHCKGNINKIFLRLTCGRVAAMGDTYSNNQR